jgi:hypothetical protein
MLLENLGIDRVLEFGDLSDWKAAIAARECARNYPEPRLEVNGHEHT